MSDTFFDNASKNMEDLTWKEIFSDVFKGHTKEETERSLIKGLGNHVPTESRMLSEWQKPWLFMRFALFGLLFSVLSVFLWYTFTGFYNADYSFVTGLQGLDFSVYMILAFFPPMTILLFFWEMNVPGTISVFEAVFLMLLGGLLSGMVTGAVWSLVPGIPQALGGPLPEEIAKFLIVLLVLRRGKYKYGLEGLVIGCAVGAGFAAIETAGYGMTWYKTIYETYMNQIDSPAAYVAVVTEAQRSAINTLMIRAALSIGGHAIWAAMYGGALALAKKGGKRLKGSAVVDPMVILTVLAAFILHFLWNLDVSQLVGVLPDNMVLFVNRMQSSIYLWWIVLIILGWTVLMIVLRSCLTQIIQAGQRAAAGAPAPQVPVPKARPVGKEILFVVATGEFNPGKSYVLREESSIIFGRDASKAAVAFPADTGGISSVHCEIKVKEGYPVLIDRNSSYGTYFSNGQKLEPDVPYKLQDQVKFYLASGKYEFTIRM